MQSFKQWPIYLIGRILPAAIGFGAIALYTRLLDPASFGTYALLLSTASLIGTTAYSWLKVASLRLTATVAPDDESKMVTTIGVAFAALSIPVFLIVAVVVRLYIPHLEWTQAVLAGACAVASAWFELNIAMLQARLRVTMYGLLQFSRVVVAFVTSVILIHAGLKADALLGGFAIGNCTGFGALSLWKRVTRGHFDSTILRQLFRIGWPSSAGALGSVSNTFQRYMLATVGGSAAVGIYAAASDFSQQTVGLLIGTATLAGQPLAFRARDLGTNEQLAEQLRNNAKLVFGVGLPAAAGLTVLAGPISKIYLGSLFHLNADILIAMWALITLLAGLRGSYFEQVFEIAQDTNAVALNMFVRLVLTIGLSFWLIERYGAVGAALAMITAEVVGLVFSIVLANRLMHVPVPWVSWLKISTATAIMATAIAIIPGHFTFAGLAAAVTAGIVVYSSAIILFHPREVRAFVKFPLLVPQRSSRP